MRSSRVATIAIGLTTIVRAASSVPFRNRVASPSEGPFAWRIVSCLFIGFPFVFVCRRTMPTGPVFIRIYTHQWQLDHRNWGNRQARMYLSFCLPSFSTRSHARLMKRTIACLKTRRECPLGGIDHVACLVCEIGWMTSYLEEVFQCLRRELPGNRTSSNICCCSRSRKLPLPVCLPQNGCSSGGIQRIKIITAI